MENGLVRTAPPRLSFSAAQLHDDVLGKIFRPLTDDFSSLKAASLVCRTWAMSTRRFVFESITMRPSNISTLVKILTQHPWPTIVPNVRRLEAYGTPDKTFRKCHFLDLISCHLTHLTLRDSAFASFEILITTIHNVPQLQAIALLDIRFPSLSKKCQYAGRFLPPSVRRFRLRNTSAYPILAWLSAHPDIPPITHLDLGQLDDNEFHIAAKILFDIAPSLRHIILSFGYGVMEHTLHEDKAMFEWKSTVARRTAIKIKVNPTPNSVRFHQVFGIPTCGTFSLMPELSVVHIESFAGLHAALSSAANATEFLAARLLASVPGTHLKRVILGLGTSSAAQLCRYNINWPFFDEILTSDAYKALEAVEFRHLGRGNLDNIANYISTKLPLTTSKNLLCFRTASNRYLSASDYA